MKRKAKFFAGLFLACISMVFLQSCDKTLKGLSNDQKKLVKKVVHELKNSDQGEGGLNFLNAEKFNVKSTKSQLIETFLKNYFNGAKFLDPISNTDAKTMFDNHARKINEIQLTFGAEIRGGLEAKSILIPADSLKIFADSLIHYQTLYKSKTGARFVFGSYPFDNLGTGPTTSGKETFFIVGTIDTTGNLNTFNSMAHRDMSLLGGFLSLSARNHGELCPDRCSERNTIYK
ncbi:MAG TPA: hypothetical protein VK483_11745 [Chitinophagaceae bacterium]|nr:hypothetical protein [Chitinophagaceae bacterium]